MKCSSPFFHKELGLQLPCGQCIFCRLNKRNAWSARMLMEKECHTHSSFLTLTYEEMPNPPSLSKPDFQKFMKRLRKFYHPLKIRYFACGEYGDTNNRPHYHAILFGIPCTTQTRKDMKKIWGLGRTSLDPVAPDCISYVAGYVSKKYRHNKKSEYIIANGLEPEFALMSRRPALGSPYLSRLVDKAFLQNPYDVLKVIRVGGRNYPLDRLMREKLRALTMLPDDIETVKTWNKQIMRENLEDLILAELTSKDLLNFKSLSLSRGDASADEGCANIAGWAYSLYYDRELKGKEHYLKSRKIRKDL